MAKKSKKNKNDLVYNDISAFGDISFNKAIMMRDKRGKKSYLSQIHTLENTVRNDLLTLQRHLLSRLYVENEIIQSIIDTPIDDVLRDGLSIKCSQISPEELIKFQTKINTNGDLNTVGSGLKWERLFGGGGFIIATDDGMMNELKVEKLFEKEVGFKAFDRWEITPATTNYEDGEMVDPEYWYYYGHRIHNSRVVRFKGKEVPSIIKPSLGGWGMSIVEDLVRAMNQFLKTSDLTFEVLDEFKLDIFRIKGLSSMFLRPNGEEIVKRRVALANSEKNYLNAITLDADDNYEQKTLNFTGISEVMNEIRMQIACALKMPITKIFGTSTAGFSSGEDEIKNYNANIKSMRTKLKPTILQLITIRFVQEFGFVPDDLDYEHTSLEIVSQEQEETIKTKVFDRIILALEKGVISPAQAADAINKDKLLPITINPEDVINFYNEKKDREKLNGELANGNDT